MKYQSQALRFSLEQRRMLNEKVIYLLDSQSCNQYDITGEDIFNAYTGIGGLHRLSQGDFSNYHEYSHLLVETNAYQTAILASTQQQLHGRWTLHHRG